MMSFGNINSVISVMPVCDFEVAQGFYVQLFGREPDVVPMEGIAEWQIMENAWIQVSSVPGHVGSTSVVIGVNNLEALRDDYARSGMAISDIEEYPGVIKMAEIKDPEGNTIAFVQDISGDSGS